MTQIHLEFSRFDVLAVSEWLILRWNINSFALVVVVPSQITYSHHISVEIINYFVGASV